MNMPLTLFTLLATAFLALSDSSAEPGSVYARAGSQVEVKLEVKTAPDLVINRKKPPLLVLRSPFEGEVLAAELSGEPWSAEPETYFAQLEPVTWQLSVPEGTAPGSYPLIIQATFSLCDSAVGVCFTEAREIAVTLYVDAVGKNKSASVFLDTLAF